MQIEWQILFASCTWKQITTLDVLALKYIKLVCLRQSTGRGTYSNKFLTNNSRFYLQNWLRSNAQTVDLLILYNVAQYISYLMHCTRQILSKAI